MAQEQNSQTLSQDKGQPTVLVIHQDGTVADSCRAALSRHGYHIETASSGNEGLNRIFQVIPDVILVGSAVPELNGYQICRLVKHDPMLKKIPVLLVSDAAEKMDRFWGVKAGADDFMSRDELGARLLKKIQMVLEIYDRMDITEKNLLRNQDKNPFNIRTRLNQILDASLVESTLMVEFRSLTDLVHDASLLNYMMFSLLESILEYDAAAVFYNDENKGPRVLTIHIPEGKSQNADRIEQMKEDFFSPLKPKVTNSHAFEILEVEVIGNATPETEPVDYQTQYIREVHVDGQLIGSVALYSRQKVNYALIFPVQLVEDELRLLMKLRHLYSQAEMLAMTDSLTGLFNHRHLMMTLNREFKSSKRYELDLSMAVIGVDNFKQLNDEWGYGCGDEILRHVAQISEASFRSVDIPARYGGKYLAVVFPQTPADQSLIALERFQQRVAEAPLKWNDIELNLTVSVGLSTIHSETETTSALIKTCEEALQAARNKGANRIEISPF